MPSAKPFSIFWAALPALFMCLFLLPASVGLAARSARPAWVSDMHAYHCYRAYIVARGSGGSGREAETDALRGLAGVFGLNVRAVETVTALSRQTAIDGAVTWTQDTEFRRILETSVERENLIGAEVRERWDDGRGTHYVLAVIPRATAVVLYSGRIAANRDVVANLVGMSDAERNTITGFARYRSAAAFADMNVTYGEILVSLRAPWSEPLLGGEYFRRRAQAVARQIPVAINVRGVNQAAAGRIRSAFAEVLFAEFGFLTGGANHRYSLNVDVTMEPHSRGGRVPGTNRYFFWYEVSVDVYTNIVETGSGLGLLPFRFEFPGEGDGHINRRNAENTALNETVRIIRGEYGNQLSRLVPGR